VKYYAGLKRGDAKIAVDSKPSMSTRLEVCPSSLCHEILPVQLKSPPISIAGTLEDPYDFITHPWVHV